jgi:hypothetical protein
VQRIADGRTVQILGARAIERSGGGVCDLHHARGDEERGFLGLASKPKSTVCEWFDLKTSGDSFLRFDLKTGGLGFPVWASKPTAPV